MRRRFQIVGGGLAALVLGILVACQARADGVPTRVAQPRVQAQQEVALHQGFYVGVQAGVGFANTDVGLTGTPLSIEGLSGQGAIYGAHTGYDHRIGRIVFGAFGEFNRQDLSFDVKPEILNAKLGDSWTLGLRAGVVVAEALPYVFAGHTWTDSEISLLGTQLTSNRLNGWTGGAGVDLPLTQNIYLGVRYAYTRYDNEDLLGLGFLNLEREQHAVTARASVKFDVLK